METLDRNIGIGGRTTRRAFVAGGVATLGAGCTRPAAIVASTPEPSPLGVQLYSVAKEVAADLSGTLSAVAAIGYRTVELAGYAGTTPQALRNALDAAGLRCTSAHIPGRPFRPAPRTLDDDLALIAADAAVLGFDTVVMPLFVTPPHLPVRVGPGADVRAVFAAIVAQMTERDWHACADYMNAKAAGLKTLGLKLAFHNHGIEFRPLGTRSVMDLLIATTDPALVSFQLDCGWAAGVGVDPAGFIRRHAGRVTSLHIKDVAQAAAPSDFPEMVPADLGRGLIDWRSVMQAARSAGISRFFVEQEAPYARPVLQSLGDSLRFLRTIEPAGRHRPPGRR